MKVYLHSRWFYLFHALIGLLILYPFFEQYDSTQVPWTLAFLNSIVIISIIYTVTYKKHHRLFALLLGIPTLILYWLPISNELLILRYLLTALLFLYTILIIVPHLLNSKHVNISDVFGVISLYILLGMMWAVIFQLIEFLAPGSFYFIHQDQVRQTFNWSDMLFYSFTTLTTLGYGDIVPITSYAQSLAILEAITGVIFIAVMVARTIGLYIFSHFKEKS